MAISVKLGTAKEARFRDWTGGYLRGGGEARELDHRRERIWRGGRQGLEEEV